MKRGFDAEIKIALRFLSSTQWKFAFLCWGIIMLLVIVGVMWLNAGAKSISALQDQRIEFLSAVPEEWVFAIIVSVLLFIPGYFLVKRN